MKLFKGSVLVCEGDGKAWEVDRMVSKRNGRCLKVCKSDGWCVKVTGWYVKVIGWCVRVFGFCAKVCKSDEISCVKVMG